MKRTARSFIYVLLYVAAMAVNSVAQTNWTKHGMVLDVGTAGSWDDHYVAFACVMYDSMSSTFKMWYTGGQDEFLGQIGYATSPDGLTWTKYENNPVLMTGPAGSWDDYAVLSPNVVFDGDNYHMWYSGFDSVKIEIGYATSTDGINWIKYENNPVLETGPIDSWDEDWVYLPSVNIIDSTFHMWYAGYAPDKIGYATSPDGIIWTKRPGNPVLDAGYPGEWDDRFVSGPNVLIQDNMYQMWYYGSRPSSELRRIGYAESTDGIVWEKYAANPVMVPLEWENMKVQNPYVLSFNDMYHMWYSGGGFFTFRIGYATAPEILNVPDEFETIQEAIDAAVDGNVVLVDEGTYYENINFKGKAITVASHFYIDGDTSHISKTIIDGSQPSHPDTGSVVRFISGEDTTSVLCGFTIAGGSGTQLIGFVGIAGYGGGGILLHSGGKIIHNKITDNHISTNQVAGGAGLLVSTVNSSNIIIEDNSITYNTSVTPTLAHGGGMVLRPRWNGGFIHVQNNFIGNNAVTCTGTYKANGAGIGVSLNLPTTGTIIIENNEITDNELHCIAAMGAGIYVVYYEPGGLITDTIPTPLIYNNIITNNFSQDKGAGIGIWTIQNNHDPNSVICPQPAIINNTIVGNRASDGCGIFNFDSDPLILNNILWNDLSVEGSREIFNDDIDYPEYSDKVNDGVIYAYYSDIQGSWEDEGNIDSDPLFADTINFYLTQQSPCIDAGYDNSFFNDLGSGGIAQWPAMGSLRNDLGTYGGPYEYDQAVLTDIIKIITNIQGNIQNMATNFHLSQNYPNPFNPSTTIEFTLSKFEFVELKVYNILGKEVSTLVSNKLNQGNHTYTFDGRNLASGVYYYQIKAGNFVQTRKMIYLK